MLFVVVGLYYRCGLLFGVFLQKDSILIHFFGKYDFIMISNRENNPLLLFVLVMDYLGEKIIVSMPFQLKMLGFLFSFFFFHNINFYYFFLRVDCKYGPIFD